MSFIATASRPADAPTDLCPAEPVPTDLPPTALTAIAAGLASALTGDEITLEGSEPRAFVRLLEAPTYEAWLIAWGPIGALDLHDHGGSAGAIHVVQGELMETYTDRHRRDPLRSRSLQAGDDVHVPVTRVHEVWNAGTGVALSVHVYSPRVTTMTFYDPDPSRFLAPLHVVETSAAEPAEVNRG